MSWPAGIRARGEVRIDREEDDVSHLEPEEQKYHRIMAKQ